MGLSNSNDAVARRYDLLAPVFPLMELAFWMPPRLRRAAVDALQVTPGDRVLEIGCGSGRNLRLLGGAVGPTGSVVGTDISAGMLRQAERLIRRRRMTNVALKQQDAAELGAERFDAILFSLAYSVMPNRHEALRRAWQALEPGGRLVIFDSGTFGPLGRALDRASRLLSRATVLGDPAIRPWEELEVHADRVDVQLFQGGTYVVCRASKPASGAARRPASTARP